MAVPLVMGGVCRGPVPSVVNAEIRFRMPMRGLRPVHDALLLFA